jgi:hypothetical protein
MERKVMRSTSVLFLIPLVLTGCFQPHVPAPTSKETVAPAQLSSDMRKEVQHFSKTKELLLSMNSMKYMLDLDTDRTMDPPATPRAEQDQMDLRSNQMQPYERPAGLVGRSLRGKRGKPSDWNLSASDIRDTLARDDLESLAQVDYEAEEPATYFFKTRDGTEGVLQLLAVVDEPKGIRVRYKTLVTVSGRDNGTPDKSVDEPPR